MKPNSRETAVFSNDQNTAIIICTEKGRLERQAVLLAITLRFFGGNLSQLPIYSFAPRAGYAPTGRTLEWFDFLNVSHLTVPLNTRWPSYPLANKPIVCDYAEKTLQENCLVFIDSDQIFFNEPLAFAAIPPNTVFVRPVDVKGIGTVSLQESNYWNELYNLFNLQPDQLITTTVDQTDILPYFNSGLIVTQKVNGLFSVWNTVFSKIMESGISPLEGDYFIEQSSFTIATLVSGVTVSILPLTYNVPLHSHRYRKSHRNGLHNGITFHYHSELFGEKYKSFSSLIHNDHIKSLTLDQFIREISNSYKLTSILSSGILNILKRAKSKTTYK